MPEKREPRQLRINARFIETLGYLAASPRDRQYSREFFEKRGLRGAIDALVTLEMVDTSGPSQTPYRINERGLEYAHLLLDAASTLCNNGKQYCTFAPTADPRIREVKFHQFPSSEIKIKNQETRAKQG